MSNKSIGTAFLGLALAGGVFAQDIVELAPFWETFYNYVVDSSALDLYKDMNLPDTINHGISVPVTWESSDTLFLGHDGHINGRLVGENKDVTLTASPPRSFPRRSPPPLPGS